MRYAKYEVREWLEHPVTIGLLQFLREAYDPGILILRAQTEGDLQRAKGQIDIIEIIRKPYSYLDIEEPEDG